MPKITELSSAATLEGDEEFPIHQGPSTVKTTLDDIATYVGVSPGGGAGADGSVCCGRLTLESGVPVSTTDQTAKTTVYWTPYRGAAMDLYDGAAWQRLTGIAETSLALGTLTSGKNYDVFGAEDSSGFTLELSAAWSSNTARSDALALQDGIKVKSSDHTRRYLGTIYTTGTTTTEDSAANRYLYNEYNRSDRLMAAPLETANSWNWSTASFRQANANAANQLNYTAGSEDVLVTAHVSGGVLNSSASGRFIAVGVGVDSTSVNSAQHFGDQTLNTSYMKVNAYYAGKPGIGKHFLAWLERGAGADTQTWLGDNNDPTAYQSRITGTIRN